MAKRYYLVPKVTDSGILGTHPKYTDVGALGPGWNVGQWQAMDYGLENAMLVALDLSAGDHALLAAQTDVLAVPPLANTVTAGTLATVKAKLESVNLPAAWVTVGMTYQTILGRVIRLIRFKQRYRALFGRLFEAGITLETRINQIPVGTRTRLATAAASLGLDTSGIVGTTLVRDALWQVSAQIDPSGVPFAGDVF